MKRRTFFKYLLGVFSLGFASFPFLGNNKAYSKDENTKLLLHCSNEKPPKLFMDIRIGYKGKEWAGRVGLSGLVKENGKMDYEKFDHMGKVLVDSGRRRLQKEGAVECYRDYDGTELIPC